METNDSSEQLSDIMTPEDFNLINNLIYNAQDDFHDNMPKLEPFNTTECVESTNQDLSRGPTGKLPCIEDFPGDYSFQISLVQSDKCSWMYSDVLKKVFTDVNKTLVYDLRISPPAGVILEGLKVRALLMYTSSEDLSRPVERCFLHWFRIDNKNDSHQNVNKCLCPNYGLPGHVLTSENENAIYEYNEVSERHSVLVPIDTVQPGYQSTIVRYTFGCKTSCNGGMARRPARIVFTLETARGEVVGRCQQLFKVCSCPKRDKEREERDYYKKIESTEESPPLHSNLQKRSSTNHGRRKKKCTLVNDKSEPKRIRFGYIVDPKLVQLNNFFNSQSQQDSNTICQTTQSEVPSLNDDECQDQPEVTNEKLMEELMAQRSCLSNQNEVLMAQRICLSKQNEELIALRQLIEMQIQYQCPTNVCFKQEDHLQQ